jgi:hypothetical protein
MKRIQVIALFVLAFSVNGTAQDLKGHPWIFEAYRELYFGREPNAWELNVNNYNGGKWSTYAQLKQYIREFQNSLKGKGVTITTENKGNDKILASFVQNGKLLAVDIVSADGGKVIAAGGGKVIAAGCGNAVASNGVTFQITESTAGIGFAGKYTIHSPGTTVIPVSGQASLIIR